jgi:hypothetical protein
MGHTIAFKHSGSFTKLEKFLIKNNKRDYTSLLKIYGDLGVQALSQATPKKTGLTAGSWYYDIVDNEDSVSIQWKNRNLQNGVNVAILLQYGHGTGTGGYVQGIDYINPAMRPIFETIADKAWEAIKR